MDVRNYSKAEEMAKLPSCELLCSTYVSKAYEFISAGNQIKKEGTFFSSFIFAVAEVTEAFTRMDSTSFQEKYGFLKFSGDI